MISSDFRTDARRKLDGKWGKAVCIVLASLLISIAINAIQSIFPDDSLISSVASLAAAIIEVPIQFGLIFAFLKLFLGEDVKAFDFWTIGFTYSFVCNCYCTYCFFSSRCSCIFYNAFGKFL